MMTSKDGNDLSNLIRVIIDDVCIESFKTDTQNTLPRQIRSVVQKVHGEVQGKQRILHKAHLTRLHRVTWGF
jgi:hypothetical protein